MMPCLSEIPMADYVHPLLGEKRAEDRVLVVARTTGHAFEVSEPTWRFLEGVSGRNVATLGQLTDCQAAFLAELAKHGLVGPAPAEEPSVSTFAPRRLILLPTADCNLRCTYCFSLGGAKTTTMTPEVARAAVRFVIERIRDRGGHRFSLGFLGGGEPTLALELMQETWEYASELCGAQGLSFAAGLTTNGYWSETTGRWIANHFHQVTVSLDGTAPVMALHRPTAGGVNSFEIVTRNLQLLVAAGCRVGVRSTVSAQSLPDMEAALDLFHSFGVRSVHFEPLTPVGRADESGIRAPEEAEFLDAFCGVQEAGRELGMRVTCSAALKRTNSRHHCQVVQKVMYVTADGALTACHRSAGGGDEVARQFHYGRYDPDRRSFEIDRALLDGLLADSAAVPAACAKCIASVHCTGGCYYDNVVSSGSRTRPREEWCRLSRELMCRLIEQRLHAQPKD